MNIRIKKSFHKFQGSSRKYSLSAKTGTLLPDFPQSTNLLLPKHVSLEKVEYYFPFVLLLISLFTYNWCQYMVSVSEWVSTHLPVLFEVFANNTTLAMWIYRTCMSNLCFSLSEIIKTLCMGHISFLIFELLISTY